MSKVSSKYQITLPRDLARSHRILPGEDVVFEEAGSALYLRRGQAAEPHADSVEGRLAAFDRASQRQEARNRAYPASLKSSGGRGWTREELYQR